MPGGSRTERSSASSSGGGPSRSSAPLWPRGSAAGPRGPRTYAYLSTRPLHILVFLLPLVILYETGSAFYLVDPSSGMGETIRARSLLAQFFEAFGAVGLFLPGVALVTVLLVWQVLTRDSWRVRWPVPAGMFMESCVLMLPILVLSAVVNRLAIGPGREIAAALVGGAGAGSGGGVGAGHGLLELPWQARLTISIGAGIYEELLFRMIGIAAIHMVLVDVARVKEGIGRALAVIISAAAFALYHDISSPSGQTDLWRAVFYLGAGLYFGVVFLFRGFGIVVGAHALYDVMVLVMFPTLASGSWR